MAEHRDFRDHLTPETQLLLCCARTQMDAAHTRQAATLLQREIDWAALLQMALRHRVAPLLYRSLHTPGLAGMPETIQAELKARIQVDVQGNLFLTGKLLHLLDLFRQQEIAVIPYKGPVLAMLAYGDLALRPFRDIDLLIDEQDIERAVALLTAQGYQIIRPEGLARASKKSQPFQVRQRMLNSAWAYQLVLSHPHTQVTVELHWRVTPRYIFPADTEPFWANLQPVSVSGVTLHSFAVEPLLWFLCVHGSKHCWTRLNWICDLAELLRACPDLDWGQVIGQAGKLNIERQVYLGLHLANLLLDTPLPSEVEAKIQATPQVGLLAAQVIDRLFDPATRYGKLPFLARLAFNLQTMDRLADRSRYLSRFLWGSVIPATTDGMIMPLPSFPTGFNGWLRSLRHRFL